MQHPTISRRQFLGGSLATAAALALAGCSGQSSSNSSSSSSSSSDKKKILWGKGASGNFFVTIARKQGYFDEVGIEIEDVSVNGEQVESLIANKVDVVSNDGTWAPIQKICKGEDFAIIGGHMLTGCMPVIAREGTTWNGPEDFLGKTVADTKSRYALFHTLAEAGHDIEKEINLRSIDGTSGKTAAAIAAVLKGEVDYATMGTSAISEIEKTDGIQIVTYCSDVTPNYSCCRLCARDSWVKENKETVKLLNMALIHAQCYWEKHKEDCVSWMAEELNATEDYIKAYALNEHYRVNADPIKNIVLDNFDYMKLVGGVEDSATKDYLASKVYHELYKEALDEATSKWGSEDKQFYDDALAFYKEHNL